MYERLRLKTYRFAIYCLFFKNEKRVKSGRKLRGNLSFWALNFNIFFQKRAKNGLKVVGLCISMHFLKNKEVAKKGKKKRRTPLFFVHFSHFFDF
jgi:hypothetical protein